ncbi:hypothetical protein [Chitinimonas sp. BJYL2]|uniref:hypothetical protein n=1 Tax=Chitinimonas sp. BJYL2 TaxID=2976696 RepID=UPI0022B4F515|nr:hypothetical protein [Chitinimonas sp. BJYL2]
MLKLAIGCFVAAWALLLLIGLTGNLMWDNRLLWWPLLLLGLSCMLGLTSWDHEQRGYLLLVGVLSFCGMLVYSLFIIIVFAYSGY